ncbi:L,D-transpeptidase family protein [Sphingomonas sp. 1P06PA]|uniref:L,D-transpeptidase family protein n=1 Tax=Sphingomonas sp. 1P06PA TaxID=554121 RepID=UPI0039A57814
MAGTFSPRTMAVLMLATAGGAAIASLLAAPRDVATPQPEIRVVPAPPPAPAPAPVAIARATPIPPRPKPEPFVVRRILDVPAPFRHGDSVWDESGAPQGPIVVTIDLAAQTLSVFRGGYEIGSAVILYGADEKPTPLGAFQVSQKDADHISNLYGAPMPYMLRLTNDGISIHGADVVYGRATHGCVGVPTAFARKLFKVVRHGDTVIVTNGKRLDMGEAIKPA